MHSLPRSRWKKWFRDCEIYFYFVAIWSLQSRNLSHWTCGHQRCSFIIQGESLEKSKHSYWIYITRNNVETTCKSAVNTQFTPRRSRINRTTRFGVVESSSAISGANQVQQMYLFLTVFSYHYVDWDDHQEYRHKIESDCHVISIETQ